MKLQEVRETGIRSISLKQRASDKKFNTPLSDSSQDYTVSSVENAYIKGSEDQNAIDKLNAIEAFCKVRCPYEQCEVPMCERINKFVKMLGGWH